ncbi:MAG TPA: ABC transporter substrate-binding protein [Nocardioides sp.]|nr:ABC transporter substrate-binding protein [Nocardioides sp.]
MAAIALLASACGGGSGDDDDSTSGDTTGVTDDTIKLGTTQPLTGPAAPGYKVISDAMTAYFEHVNAEGGVNGRKIELIVEDDGYDPSKTAAQTRKLVEKDKVFALVGALGTPTHSQVLDYVRDSKIPDLFVSSGSLAWNQPDKYPATFGWQTDYTREGKVLATYVKDKFAGKTMCSFGQGDDLGRDGVKGLETILGPDGLKKKEEYSPANQDVAPQIGNLKAAGCEVVFNFTIPGFTALAMGTAAQLGFRPQWVQSSVGADPVALKGYLKENAEALTQGTIAGNYLPPTDPANSWFKAFSAINDEYGKGIELSATAIHGYALGYAVVQALLAAGEDPTRESLIEAVAGGKLTLGPSPTPFAYSADDHSGMTGVQVVEIDKLRTKELTKPMVTDDGDGPVEESTVATEEAPENGIPQS